MSNAPADVLEAWRRAEVIVDAAALTRAVDQTAVRIALALQDANPLVLCVMHGGLTYCGRRASARVGEGGWLPAASR